MKRYLSIISLVAVLAFATLANANSLVNNGGGLFYDPDLDITWYDAPSDIRSWKDTLTFVAGLTIGGTSAGSWRLPTTPIGTIVNTYTHQGEMAHLYYDELNNSAGGPLANRGEFANLLPENNYTDYWSGTLINSNLVYVFNFLIGVTETGGTEAGLARCLAVHEGNVSNTAVPEPATMLLVGFGLVGLAGFRRKFIK